MLRALIAGACYAVAVFLLSVPLGPVRVFFVTPQVGAVPAMLAELVVVLTIAWFLSAAFARWLKVPPDVPHRIVMGAVALAGVLAGELIVSLAMERSLPLHFAAYAAVDQQLRLVAQLLFAAFPPLRR